MGVVKFDLKSDEVKLKNFSLNSVEDIYEFMNVLDIIYDEHVNGNTYATCLSVDFCKLMDSITDNFYIKMFYNIQIGKVPISPIEIEEGYVELNEVAAYRLNIKVDKFLEGLHSNVVEMSNKLHSNWLDNINRNYKNKLIQTDVKEIDQSFDIDYERLKEIDALMKYSYSNRTYQGELPSDIQELYEYRDTLVGKIKELEKQKKELDKKDPQYNKLKEITSRLQTFKIQVNKDIIILKEHYGISIENRNQKGQVNAGNNISYNVENGDVVSSHEKYINELKYEQFSSLMDSIYIGKIRETAENCLTSRQFIIFELYYSIGLTQQEIADTLGDSRDSIKMELPRIVSKISKNINI